MAVGTRIYAVGHGHGTYAGFTGRWMGANEHTIEFEGGVKKELKLKEMEWAVKDSEITELVLKASAPLEFGAGRPAGEATGTHSTLYQEVHRVRCPAGTEDAGCYGRAELVRVEAVRQLHRRAVRAGAPAVHRHPAEVR